MGTGATSPRVDVVVVGGGISGLAAARGLAAAGLQVLVLEASPRLGGKIAAASLGELRCDVGAESVLVRRPEALALISALGLDPRLVHPTAAAARVFVDGQGVDLPPSAMGIPGDLEALAPLLSEDGLRRARLEPSLPAPPLTEDVAIGRLVDERFGPEVTDRLLEPLLGGVYAGHSRRLSFAAVNAALFARVRDGGALSGHAVSGRRAGDGPVFGGLVGGITGLVDALVVGLESSGVELRCEATVRELTPTAGGYRLTVRPRTDGPARDPYAVETRAVLLATPAGPTGRLLSGLVGAVEVAEQWAGLPYASMVVVALAVRGVDPVGSGLLVPPGQLPTIKAVTHSSRKWAWVGEAAGQVWGDGAEVVRASVGRRGEERLLQVDDAELTARTVAELSGLPGWDGAEVLAGAVQRWGGGLPQYEVGHRELVGRVQREVTALPGLAVCGAAYDGVGIAACLGSAAGAVTKITAELGAEKITEAVGRQS